MLRWAGRTLRLGALVAAGLAAAPGAAAPTAESEPGVDVAALRAGVAFLADDLLEGRDTGSRGHEIAARYAVSRFASAGLEPGAGDGFEQRVPFVRADRVESKLAVRRSGGRQKLRWQQDYLIAPSPRAEPIERRAAVVFVGWGIEAPELGRDDYAGVDVRGKFVLLFGGAPASFPHDERAHYSSSRTKAETAAAHGAAGTIYLSSRSDLQRVPWERRTLNPDRPLLRWRHPDGRIERDFPGLDLDAHLSPEGARRLLAGSGVTLDELLDGEAAGELASRPLPIELEVELRSRLSEITSPNVVARLPGSDPALAGEAVVVTAHLDHVGIGAAVDGDTIYNGYYDNALGSAMVLELARELAESREDRPRRSILFVLVTGEEKGLLGSDYFAQHPTVPRDALVADVNLDMPMVVAPLADLLAYGAEHSSLLAPVERAAAAHGFILGPDPHPEEVVFVRSDQYSFVRQGIPAVFLDAGFATRGGGDEQQRRAEEFLATHYHRPSDDGSEAPDWDSAARLVATARDLVREIADAPERPRWKQPDFFGDRYGGGR